MSNELPNMIRKIRKEKGFRSAQSLADALGVHLKTVQNWENDASPKLPDLDNLLALCRLFDCDLDYLTGRMEEPTHEIRYIRSKTGLSVEAIRKLMKLKGTGFDEFLSELIENGHSEALLRRIHTASDDREIWWDGLWTVPAHQDDPDKYEGVADYLATSSLAGMISDIRCTNREPDAAAHWKIDPEVLNEHERREKICGLIDRCETTEDLQRKMDSDDSLSKEDREMIRSIWKKTIAGEENISDLSYMEWSRLYGRKESDGE